MRPYLKDAIGSHASLAPATAALLTERLGGALDSEKLMLVLEDRLDEALLARDLNAVVEGDPAAPELLTCVSGAHFPCTEVSHTVRHSAVRRHRVSGASLWSSRTEDPGRGAWLRRDGPKHGSRSRRRHGQLLQGAASAATGVDIHAAGATMGSGVFIDHATGALVIGEQAAVGDDCYILHGADHRARRGATGKTKNGATDPHVGSA